jgi:hypothetical protein
MKSSPHDSEETFNRKMSRADVVQHPTPNAKPVGEVLDSLQAQAKDAIPADVFTDGATADKAPLMKRMRSEIGSAEVTAAAPDADVQTHIEMEVRCDRNEDDDGGTYQVRAQGHVARGSATASIPVAVRVDERDGGLRLNPDEMRDGITEAVRATERDGSDPHQR